MGVGKTKEFLALIEADTRLRKRKRELLSQQKEYASEPFPFQDELENIPIQTEEDGNVWFRPTPIVNPVNTIHQTYREAMQNFPSLNIKIYYGSSNNFPDGKVCEGSRKITKEQTKRQGDQSGIPKALSSKGTSNCDCNWM